MTTKILVVNDQSLMGDMMSLHLRQRGYNTRVALDGRSALQIAEQWSPDVILLDIMMPEIDGFEVCQNLKENESTASIPVIIVSAVDNVKDKVRLLQAGADDYVTIPFDSSELLARVEVQARRTGSVDRTLPQEAGKTIAVFSLRGGSGSTSIAVNLSVGLATMWQRAIGLIDLSLPLGACDILLNVRPRTTLAEFVHEYTAEIEDEYMAAAITDSVNGVDLFAGIDSPVAAELVTSAHAEHLMRYFQHTYPYVVIDLPHDFSEISLTVLRKADVVIMPIMPDVNSLRVGYAALRVFEQVGIPLENVVAISNWVYPENGLSNKELEKILKHDIQLVFANDPKIGRALNSGHPFITERLESDTQAAFEELLWMVSNTDDAPPDKSAMYTRIARRFGAAGANNH